MLWIVLLLNRECIGHMKFCQNARTKFSNKVCYALEECFFHTIFNFRIGKFYKSEFEVNWITPFQSLFMTEKNDVSLWIYGITSSEKLVEFFNFAATQKYIEHICSLCSVTLKSRLVFINETTYFLLLF